MYRKDISLYVKTVSSAMTLHFVFIAVIPTSKEINPTAPHDPKLFANKIIHI